MAFVYTDLYIILYRTFDSKMTDIELNKLTFYIFIFEGVGELLGGLAMVMLTRRIKDTAQTYQAISTLFMLSVAVIYLASLSANVPLFCMGVVVTGFCDCVSMVIGLSLAGNWVQRGMTAYNAWQSLTVAATVLFMVFVSF